MANQNAALQDCLDECPLQRTFGNVSRVLYGCTSPCYEDAGWTYTESGSSTPLYVSLLIASVLILLSGLFSGLTLGLMSLDMLGLEILMEGGEPDERRYAASIMPVRRRGNLLLCTLLLGNTLVNSLIAILLASLTSGVVGGMISTFAIVVFGEIIPQAACSRHGLYIGASTLWLVKIFIFITFPISFPISLVLDKALGRDIGTVYNSNELKKLINIHVENPDAAEESGLTMQDQRLLTGALEYKDKVVKDVMTGLDKVFMMELSARLNFQLMFSIYKSGFTRIPVYETYRQNVVGILFVKDLILVDPDDEVEVRAILAFHGDRSAGYVKRVNEDVTLDRVFKYFKSSYIHLLFVYQETPDKGEDDDNIIGIKKDSNALNKIVGIISLEDVLEAVIQDEIIDETDMFVDVNTPHTTAVQRGKHKRDLSQFMALFEHKLRKQTQLSTPEINAISAYLTTNVKVFNTWKDSLDSMKALIRCSELIEFRDTTTVTDPDGTESKEELERDGSEQVPPKRQLFFKGQPTDIMVLVLQGKLTVLAGLEEFESELGPWSVLGHMSLVSESYVPDFDAEVQGAGRLLLIRRAPYLTHLRAAQVEFFGTAVKSKQRKHSGVDEPRLPSLLAPHAEVYATAAESPNSSGSQRLGQPYVHDANSQPPTPTLGVAGSPSLSRRQSVPSEQAAMLSQSRTSSSQAGHSASIGRKHSQGMSNVRTGAQQHQSQATHDTHSSSSSGVHTYPHVGHASGAHSRTYSGGEGLPTVQQHTQHLSYQAVYENALAAERDLELQALNMANQNMPKHHQFGMDPGAVQHLPNDHGQSARVRNNIVADPGFVGIDGREDYGTDGYDDDLDDDEEVEIEVEMDMGASNAR